MLLRLASVGATALAVLISSGSMRRRRRPRHGVTAGVASPAAASDDGVPLRTVIPSAAGTVVAAVLMASIWRTRRR